MEYNGKKALVCGMARSGIAAAKLLNRLGARVTLQDMKKREEISADVLHWRKSIAMHMTMIRMPSAMSVALNGR